MTKLKVGIVFGGKSTEHQVSLQSAKNIFLAIDKEKYEITSIHIDPQGHWHLHEIDTFPDNVHNHKYVTNKNHIGSSIILPDNLDVIFPITHGTLGEDGSLQGLLRALNIPFVGSDVLASAVCMDKDFTKRLLSQAGINVAPWLSVTSNELKYINMKDICRQFGFPIFIKPANQGSSIGITKVDNINMFEKALDLAFTYDRKILIEKAIKGREIECAILGNDIPAASPCGEILVKKSFYSYQKKYSLGSDVEIIIPAEITCKAAENIRLIAINSFKILECCGMARVDVFLTDNGKIFVNEVNTLPGFTNISMYPQLWQAVGLNYRDLITRLIELAQEHHAQSTILKNTI